MIEFISIYRLDVSINDLKPGSIVYAEQIALSRKYIRDIDKLISREIY